MSLKPKIKLDMSATAIKISMWIIILAIATLPSLLDSLVLLAQHNGLDSGFSYYVLSFFSNGIQALFNIMASFLIITFVLNAIANGANRLAEYEEETNSIDVEEIDSNASK